MSGLAAVVSAEWPLDESRFRAWARTLDEVGPHGLSLWSAGRIGMAHAFLRVYADDGRVSQPATLDGSVRVVADARLDAAEELRRELRAHGRSVAGDASDAELILHAYGAWGDDCPARLLGDFAFVLWDAPKERLLAAVDHFGVRRLYYAPTAQGLVISNWGATIHAHADVDRTLDDATIVSFLCDGAAPTDATAFRGIRALPPAHRLVWKVGRLDVARYWSLPVEEPLRYRDPRAYEEQFVELLTAAVADRARGQPISVLLSGGLDSPAVAAVARSSPDVSSGLTAHTGVFDWLVPDDERLFAGMVARHLRIPITFHSADETLPYGRAAALADLSLVPANSPFAGAFMERLSAAASDATVVLTGHGTDAILAAEPLAGLVTGAAQRQLLALLWHAPQHFASYRRRPPLGLRPSLARVRRREEPEAGNPPWLRGEWVAERKPAEPLAPHPYRSRAYTVASGRWVADAVGSFTPFAQRAHVACAHPFIDLRVVRFCMRLPPVPWCWDKHLLRSAFRGLLPDPILKRRKTPMRADVLHAALARPDFDWLLLPEVPGDTTRRYYAWPDFVPLRELMLSDPAWQHSRPLALELFFRGWEGRLSTL